MVFMWRNIERNFMGGKRGAMLYNDNRNSTGDAGLAFFPFGKEIVYGGGVGSLIANIIWLLCCGIPMAIENACFGLLLCITIIGIPFGLQFFKIAKLALMPFGAEIVG